MPVGSTKNLIDACDPFARAAGIVDALPDRLPDITPLRDCLPGIWPTLGDLRLLRAEMVNLGWTNEHQRRDR